MSSEDTSMLGGDSDWETTEVSCGGDGSYE